MHNTEIESVKRRYGIIGYSELLTRAIDIAMQVAPTDLSVLITGESGVGKENFPKIIHQYGYRKHGPYIPVNCGAIPEGTIDSELFGHEKGAFTGATSDRKGYFEVADGGTIFLDEVGDLPLATQVRLLRVLEAGEFIKVGSSKVLKTNVRVVAATNQEMKRAIKEGHFREDLYYRLNTVPIFVPPLRERKEDIVLLFRKFASDFADKYRMPSVKLTADAQNLLTNYYWKGNIRQLKNITEQISVIEQQREITADILRTYLPDETTERLPALFTGNRSFDQKTFNSEREILYQVLFDMKKDMHELKRLVHDIMESQPVHAQHYDLEFGPTIQEMQEVMIAQSDRVTNVESKLKDTVDTDHLDSQYVDDNDYQDVEALQEPVSLAEMEKLMIQKTLAKHRGRRKAAAQELEISERTLYRKIKEYGLD